MPKRLPYEIAILALLLAGSCSSEWHSPSDAYDLADAAQANARRALSQNDAQTDAINELGRKVRDLETMDSAFSRDVRNIQDQVNRNASIYNEQHRGGRY